MGRIGALIMLLLIGTNALALMAAIGPALAKEVSPRARAESAKSGQHHHARDWKRRNKAYKLSRRLVRPRGYVRVYITRSYENDLLIDCLLTQPFVTCP